LSIGLEKPAAVSISINNMLGQVVNQISSNNASKGEHSFVLNTANLPSGIYLVNIVSGSDAETVKLVVKH
jgi:flagellar hook assembly protein FlgD